MLLSVSQKTSKVKKTLNKFGFFPTESSSTSIQLWWND